MRNFIRHAGAFIGSFVFALSAVTLYWILRPTLTLPVGNPARDVILRMVFTYPLRQGLVAAAGAVTAFWAMRPRLRAWNVVTVPRTALVGALAGALWPVSMSGMMWLTRTVGLPPGAGTTLMFSVACGGVSMAALYFPWLSRPADSAPALLSEAADIPPATVYSTSPDPANAGRR
jgi:hypothetical protein